VDQIEDLPRDSIRLAAILDTLLHDLETLLHGRSSPDFHRGALAGDHITAVFLHFSDIRPLLNAHLPSNKKAG
jgi:hypothetical protein